MPWWRFVLFQCFLLPLSFIISHMPCLNLLVGYRDQCILLAQCIFIYLGFLRHFQHCTGHIMTGSWKGRGNQYIGFCIVNCRPTASNYQLSHLRLCREPNPGLRGGRRECYHSATLNTMQCI